MKTFTLTVTEADLDAAIARREQEGYRTCQHCIVAQTMGRMGERQWAALSIDHEGRWYYFTDTPLDRLVNAFDSREYGKVRAMLPLTQTLTAS